MERQLTERHRLGVRLPRQSVAWHPLQAGFKWSSQHVLMGVRVAVR